MAGPGLSGHQHDDASGHDPQPLPVAALADDARPGSGDRREKKLTRLRHATTRLTAGFAYIGPAMPRLQASALLGRH